MGSPHLADDDHYSRRSSGPNSRLCSSSPNSSPSSSPLSAATTFPSAPPVRHSAQATPPPIPSLTVRPLVDDSDPDDDDALDPAFDTESLTNSVCEGVIEGGLRFHAYHPGKYPFPNDTVEQERDDLKHELTIQLCNGKYFFAPLENVFKRRAKVLDMGTGTGIWCTELADLFPNVTLIGMDLSPIQPVFVPDNVHFMVDDIEHDAGWDFPDDHFDFLHMRHTLYSIRDRQTMLERSFRHLKPGGWLEIQEFHYQPLCDDGSYPPGADCRLRDFFELMRQGIFAIGADMYGIDHIAREMAQAGFTSVSTFCSKCPIGPWPRNRALRTRGEMLRTICFDGLVGLSQRPFRQGLGWSEIQIEMFLIEVRKALFTSPYHDYMPLYSVWCQKPLTA